MICAPSVRNPYLAKITHPEMRLLGILLQATRLQLDRLATWPNEAPFKAKPNRHHPGEVHSPAFRRKDIEGMLYFADMHANSACGNDLGVDIDEAARCLIDRLRTSGDSVDV